MMITSILSQSVGIVTEVSSIPIKLKVKRFGPVERSNYKISI